MRQVLKFGLAAILATLVAFSNVGTAQAADSVRVPGQIPVEQCPTGYQYNTGIEVNVSTHEEFTICNAPPTPEELILKQQDLDFYAAQRAAMAAAEVESRAWNAANPGLQKCIQWGPITHANGVATASGGVCANPVGANDAITLPSAPAAPVTVDEPVYTTQSRDAVDGPFTRSVEGQVGVEGCPAGYQGANALSVDVSTGKTTTVCWTPNAWQAWQIGGDVWEQYQATGGAYDIAAEVNRRNGLKLLRARALAVAQAAANQTPGVRRCSAWTGFGESGQECAYAFVAPTRGGKSSDSADTSDSSDTSDSTPSQTPAISIPVSSGDASDQPAAITVAAASITTASAFTILNPVKKSKVVTKSLTPKICTVSNLKVKAKAKGTCVISYKSTTSQGKTTVTKKTIIFAKSS